MLKEACSGFASAIKMYPETWTANTVYYVGELVKPTTYTSSSPVDSSRHSYLCTIAGTSHASTEPTWSTTNGATQTDNTVTWKCFDGKCYQLIAPQGSTCPYLVWGLLTERPQGTFSDFEAWEDLTFWINVFSNTSITDCNELVNEVCTSLDNVTLTVTGYTGMKCQREFIGSPIVDSTVTPYIYEIPLRMRVWLDKA